MLFDPPVLIRERFGRAGDGRQHHARQIGGGADNRPGAAGGAVDGVDGERGRWPRSPNSRSPAVGMGIALKSCRRRAQPDRGGGVCCRSRWNAGVLGCGAMVAGVSRRKGHAKMSEPPEAITPWCPCFDLRHSESLGNAVPARRSIVGSRGCWTGLVLAIVINTMAKVFCLFYCDTNWNVVADTPPPVDRTGAKPGRIRVSRIVSLWRTR